MLSLACQHLYLQRDLPATTVTHAVSSFEELVDWSDWGRTREHRKQLGRLNIMPVAMVEPAYGKLGQPSSSTLMLACSCCSCIPGSHPAPLLHGQKLTSWQLVVSSRACLPTWKPWPR